MLSTKKVLLIATMAVARISVAAPTPDNNQANDLVTRQDLSEIFPLWPPARAQRNSVRPKPEPGTYEEAHPEEFLDEDGPISEEEKAVDMGYPDGEDTDDENYDPNVPCPDSDPECGVDIYVPCDENDPECGSDSYVLMKRGHKKGKGKGKGKGKQTNLKQYATTHHFDDPSNLEKFDDPLFLEYRTECMAGKFPKRCLMPNRGEPKRLQDWYLNYFGVRTD